MTPLALKAARRTLGLSAAGLARAVGVASERTVRRWEAGSREIPGPVVKLLELWLAHPELVPAGSPSEPERIHQIIAKHEAAAAHIHTWAPYTDGDTDWDECEECGARRNERPA